jgi:hypothetical protein
MKTIAIIFTLTTLLSAASAAENCYYFAGSSPEQDVHRLVISEDKKSLTVKTMGPNLTEARGLGCTYQVRNVSTRHEIKLEVERRLNAGCASKLELLDSSLVMIIRKMNEAATSVNGVPTYDAFIGDYGSRNFWAHRCKDF